MRVSVRLRNNAQPMLRSQTPLPIQQLNKSARPSHPDDNLKAVRERTAANKMSGATLKVLTDLCPSHGRRPVGWHGAFRRPPFGGVGACRQFVELTAWAYSRAYSATCCLVARGRILGNNDSGSGQRSREEHGPLRASVHTVHFDLSEVQSSAGTARIFARSPGETPQSRSSGRGVLRDLR